jgi:hypothetical protein
VGTFVYAISYDDPSDTYAYVGVNVQRRELLIIFKGTNSSSLKDWIVDLDVFVADKPFDGIPGTVFNMYFSSRFSPYF